MALTYKIPAIPLTRGLPKGTDYIELGRPTPNESAKKLANSFVGTVANREALKALDVTDVATGTTVTLLGMVTVGDGVGGIFYYDSSSTATPDDIRIIQPTVGSGRWLSAVIGGGIAEDEIIEFQSFTEDAEGNTGFSPYQITSALNINSSDPVYAKYKNKYLVYKNEQLMYLITTYNSPWDPTVWTAVMLSYMPPSPYVTDINATVFLSRSNTSAQILGPYGSKVYDVLLVQGSLKLNTDDFTTVGIRCSKQLEYVIQRSIDSGATWQDIEVVCTLPALQHLVNIPSKTYDLSGDLSNPITEIWYRSIVRCTDLSSFDTLVFTDKDGNVFTSGRVTVKHGFYNGYT